MYLASNMDIYEIYYQGELTFDSWQGFDVFQLYTWQLNLQECDLHDKMHFSGARLHMAHIQAQHMQEKTGRPLIPSGGAFQQQRVFLEPFSAFKPSPGREKECFQRRVFFISPVLWFGLTLFIWVFFLQPDRPTHTVSGNIGLRIHQMRYL